MKKAISEKEMERLSEDLAWIEDKNAAEQTDSKTPDNPSQEHQQKKSGKNMKAHLFEEESEGDHILWETDDDCNDETDINRTVWKKWKGGMDTQNMIQAKQRLPVVRLDDAEVEGYEDIAINGLGQGNKGAKGGEG